MPNLLSRKVNLNDYFETMRSENVEDLEKYRWVFNGFEKHALDNSDIDGNMFGIFSFPRCGNTFIRAYIEAVTGISTGATLSTDESTAFSL